MNAGMGDIVFAPLYEVLAPARRALRLLPSAGAPAPLAGGRRRAAARDGARVRRPGRRPRRHVPAAGRRRRPALLAVGARLGAARRRRASADRRGAFESFWDRRAVRRTTLRVGDDFDLVVLGVGLGAVPHVAASSSRAIPRWRAMVDHVQTVATQAFQVWMREDMASLGWTAPPINLSGFVEPFDTWADMRHLLARERWPEAARALAYFCSVLPDARGADDRNDAEYPARAREQVRANAVRFLERRRRASVAARRRGRWRVPLGAARRSRGRQRHHGRARCGHSSGPPTSTRPTATRCRCRAAAPIASRPSTTPTTT